MEPPQEAQWEQVANRATDKIPRWKRGAGGDYFDCTGCGQSDRFMKTVQKIADHIVQEYKGGGMTRT
jgi:hypothetical protein